MAHHVYATDAFVIRVLASGEGSRVIGLYTEQHGYILAHARSVREERSKMRYALSPFAHVKVLLVRGAEVWRIRGIELLHGSITDLSERPSRELAARLLWSVRRFVHGEGTNPALYEALLNAHTLLRDEPLSSDELAMLERLALVKILSSLGQADVPNEILPTLTRPIERGDLETTKPFRALLTGVVNTALEESHL